MNRSSRSSSGSGTATAARQASRNPRTRGRYDPIDTSAPRSMGSMRWDSQSGSRTQSASETAMTSWVAARTARLRPRAMLAPVSSIRVTPGAARSAWTVPSTEPPSTMTISSGGRVCDATEARKSPISALASSTVDTSETLVDSGSCSARSACCRRGVTDPGLSRRPAGSAGRSRPTRTVRPAHAPGRPAAA